MLICCGVVRCEMFDARIGTALRLDFPKRLKQRCLNGRETYFHHKAKGMSRHDVMRFHYYDNYNNRRKALYFSFDPIHIVRKQRHFM